MSRSSSRKQAGSVTGLLTFALVGVLLAGAVLVRLVGDDEPTAPAGSVGVADPIATSGVARPAPGFALPDPDGRQHSLSEWRGQPMLINFWATWCGPCEIEMPTIQSAYEKFAPDGLVVLAVAVEDSADDVRRFFDRLGLTFQPLLDDGTVSRQYQVFGLPTSVFLDAEGNIVATHVGVLTDSTIADYWDQIRER